MRKGSEASKREGRREEVIEDAELALSGWLRN